MSTESITVTGGGRPMVFLVNGHELVEYTEAEAGRDLANISGEFRISYYPRQALDDFGDSTLVPVSKTGVAEALRITEHDEVEVIVHGQTVLKGWVDDISMQMQGGQFQAVISGRDATGDLVDGSANPTGPGEYRQVTLAKLVAAVCTPFGIAVSTDVDVGAPFTLVALEPAETAMAAIERHSRQRGILVTSDGVGGVVLTQSGQEKAPESISHPGNVHDMEVRISSRGRFSDVFVKGSFNSHLRPASAPLKVGAKPLDAPLGAAGAGLTPSQAEAAATLRLGHAIDPAVRRYRPRLFLAASQSGGSVEAQQTANPVDPNSTTTSPASGAYRGHRHKPRRKAMKPRTDATPWTLQDQAEWRMRSTRAGAMMRVYTMPRLRAANGQLWLPNQRVTVQDSFVGINSDMLIGAVTWVAAQDGYRTRISVVDLDAYDLKGDVDTRHNGRTRSRT